MSRLRNIAMRDYQESVTTRLTDGRTDRRRTKWSLCAAMLCRQNKKLYWSLTVIRLFSCLKWWTHFFLCPRKKGPPWVSSARAVCLSLIVRNSILPTYQVQYLKFECSYSYQTLIVSSSKGYSHFTVPWKGGGGSKCRTWKNCHTLTLLPLGASKFQKHILFTWTCSLTNKYYLTNINSTQWIKVNSYCGWIDRC